MTCSLYHINRCFVLAVSVALIAPLPALAQDDMSVEQIRRELREAAATAAAQKIDAPIAEDKESFTFSESDVGASNEKLVAAEAELLKKLEHKDGAGAAAAEKQDQAAQEITNVIVAQKPNLPEAAQAIPVEASRAALKMTESKKIEPVQQRESQGEETTVVVPASTRASKGEEPKEIVLRQQIQEIASLRKSNSDLIRRAEKSESKVLTLQKQLGEAQNRLMLAETEVERLSNVLDNRNRAMTNKLSGTAASSAAPAVARAALPPRAAAPDMPVITVIADKANLRTGPGAENSPLMAVSKGTRLVVEKREGEWYRVITPSGTRAWVSAEVVAFGPDALEGPRGALRIKGYDSSLENSPFASGQAARN